MPLHLHPHSHPAGHARGKHHGLRTRIPLRLAALLLLVVLLCAASASVFLLPSSINSPADADRRMMDADAAADGFVLGPGTGVDPDTDVFAVDETELDGQEEVAMAVEAKSQVRTLPRNRSCATVEEMGSGFREGSPREESLRVRRVIRRYFDLHGAPTVRSLPAEMFCRQGFVLGKASEAGFGNEMYKILTAAALGVILNRSLIIGQTRDRFPFEEYITYTNLSFTLSEVKHLWRKNKCGEKFGRRLTMRLDDFEKPKETNILCSNWLNWKHPIIWFQGTTDAVAIQFFLKNVHPEMTSAASILFGDPRFPQRKANVFGELMKVIVSPSESIKEAVEWALGEDADPHVTVHMRMLSNRSLRAMHALLSCIKKALDHHHHQTVRPRLVLVSDTPSFIQDVSPNITGLAEVIHFNYESYKGNSLGKGSDRQRQLGSRTRDWGPAPRWVAFVDFFLASRAKYAVISGAHRRVGTTYAQLIAALAAANQIEEGDYSSPNFTFFSSFQSNLLVDGLANQIGWGHVWNRYAGPLSCHSQPHQCAYTPLLPPGWWDGDWQSPISRDVHRLHDYGIELSETGKVIENSLHAHCKSRKESVKAFTIIR